MEITHEQQMEADFDWFCVDASSQIAHFTTAGFKKLPASVAASIANQATILNYLEQELDWRCEYRVDTRLTEEIGDPTDRYLFSFAAMAKRGLYSFDIETYPNENTNYFRVAVPTSPLSADILPAFIRSILNKTSWDGPSFDQLQRIAYANTLNL